MATRTDLELEFMDNATGVELYRTHPQGANRDFSGLGMGVGNGDEEWAFGKSTGPAALWVVKIKNPTETKSVGFLSKLVEHKEPGFEAPECPSSASVRLQPISAC